MRPPGGRAQLAGSRSENATRRENRPHDRLRLLGGLQCDHRPQAKTVTWPATADLDDFAAYLADHTFICRKTRALLDGGRGQRRLFRMRSYRPASKSNAAEPIHCLSWMPGDGEIVRDTVVMKGGKVVAEGYRSYNLYLPPTLTPVAGDPSPWLDHLKRIYPDDWQCIVDCLAFKVQHPGE